MKLKRNSGFVLIFTLMIMVAISLVAIPAMRSSTINMQIMNNDVNRALLKSRVERAIEQVVSLNPKDTNYYSDRSEVTLMVEGSPVTVTLPECLDSATAPGYSVGDITALEDVIWEFRATGFGDNGSSVTLVQGLKIRMHADSCA